MLLSNSSATDDPMTLKLQRDQQRVSQDASPAGRRMVIEYLLPASPHDTCSEGDDVIAGLTASPKSLPPKYFYDDRGSELFEQITQLPEYYLTRTETQILASYADAIAHITGPCELVELGSGSSTKTRYLLSAMARAGYPLHYLPVDVSGGMLEATAEKLLTEYPQLTIQGLVGTYDPALQQLPPTQLPSRMVAFIGSTLGNLEPQACRSLLANISAVLNGGDYFLLGVDLEKDPEVLHQAYNDSQGVTAAFNLNMLSHLNWRFQGDFQVHQFRHQAFYNADASQIEIYIESLQTQTVTLKALDLQVPFAQGEPLLSEISRKFKVSTLAQELESVGMKLIQTFTDDHQWFGLLLCQK